MINVLNENKESDFLIICDHASNKIPSKFKELGLSKEILDSHIAFDIGAKEVAVYLSNILECPLVMTDFSRLLIDPNRGIDDPTLIMKISDNKIVDLNFTAPIASKDDTDNGLFIFGKSYFPEKPALVAWGNPVGGPIGMYPPPSKRKP